MKSNVVGVIIVTFNRLEQLKIALQAYEEQTCKPKYLVVVNNYSTDGTLQYLNEWKARPSEYSKYVVNLDTNIGGSGGFYEGLKKSLELDADWIWVADDDAYPDLSAVEIADSMIQDKTIVTDQVTAICGSVINNGNIDLVHRKKVFSHSLQIREVPVTKDKYIKQYFEIDLFSYVGAIINKNVLKQVGLPKKDYFIFYDDTEHSMRFRKMGKILCFPLIKVIHNSTEGSNNDWKRYYFYRNKFDFYKTHFPRNAYLYIHFSEVWKDCWHILIGRKAEFYKIRLEAINDAYNGKLGLHKIYKPGWKFDRNNHRSL